MNLTQGEGLMLIKIARSCYNPANGAPETAEETSTFVFDVCESASDKGTIGSLVKKGAVVVDNMRDFKDEDNGICLTEEGFSEYIRLTK